MRSSFLIGSVTLVFSIAALGCGGDEDLAGPSQPAADGGGDVSNQDASKLDGGMEDASSDGTSDALLDATEDVEPDVAPPACAPPSDPSTAALCLRLDPEQLELIDADERFDGEGLFIIQVYDTPTPDLPDGSSVPALSELTIPDQPGGPTPATMNVYDLVDPVRIEGLPATVYVRALFVDNFSALSSEALLPGVWLGGWDFSEGLFSADSLEPVALSVGAGTELTLPMTALRSMKVTLTKSFFTQPLGNGQGPAGFYLFDVADMSTSPSPWGIGSVTCGSIHMPGGIDIEGVFIGGGPYFGFGYLDDYGQGIENDLPPGTMVNLTLSGSQAVLPASAEIDVPPGAYRVEAGIELSGTAPFPGLPPNDTTTCF